MRLTLLVVCLAAFAILSFGKVHEPHRGRRHAVFLNETYSTGFLSNHNEGELFYILIDSRNDIDSDPLVLWLTGGPGCSSELALFTENGPFRINPDNLSLSINPYSWNNNANLLYVDQPAGTGYSIVGNYDSTEEEVARDFYNFFLEFLNKHPQFINRPLYVTGESYAGHYIPVIASYILDQNNADINLKGVAIGNGWVDPYNQYPAYSSFAYDKALINQTLFEQLNDQFVQCQQQITDGNAIQAALQCNVPYSAIVGKPTSFNIYDVRLPCVGPLCYNFSYVDSFLAQPQVQEALGVVGRPWTECNSQVHKYFVLDHQLGYADYVTDLLNKTIPVLVYSGDLDFVCNYMGGEAWTHALDYAGHDDFLNSDYNAFNTHGQYKNAQGLTFFRVYDAGHLVPMDQPEAAITILEAFINGYFN